MAEYSLSAWRYLGGQVKTARKQAGYRDIKEWAEVVGRSTRVLLGLERGEKVGDDTLERIETALGWELGHCEVMLTGRPARPDLDAVVIDLVPMEEGENPVIAAIAADPFLLPEAKNHFLNQYWLLRRVGMQPSTSGLAHVARRPGSTPAPEPDPKVEAEILTKVEEAAARNPKGPRGTRKK